jgi:DNA helicase-2/ATP-dependent DNA helicase PcrA
MSPSIDQHATGTLEEIGRRDHEITSEYRIFGPPGTGKTTNLTRQIRRAVDRFGAGAVLVTSFSRAAAAELAGRDLPISSDRVGTLHSHCWHALGGPEIAEANVEEWNKEHQHLAITPQKRQQGKLDGEEALEDGDEVKPGDALLERLGRFRGLMLQKQAWPAYVIEFERLWTKYKRENGLLDFTDLIETAYRDVGFAPHNPTVIFADEAQDLNRMQLSLVRRWGEHAGYFIVAGDDDQTIYSFAGATPEAFLKPDIPDDHKIVLKQSYRVPRAVHRFAEGLIRTVKIRQPKEYLPRPEDGALERLSKAGTYQCTGYEILKTAIQHLERGRTIMFLAACSYMLKPLVQVLRKGGIPFHNPYRRSNGFWNPLRTARQSSTPNRILSLLIAHPDYGEEHRSWTHGDLALWADLMQARGVLRHGVKAKLKAADLTLPVTMEHLAGLFEPDALDSMMAAWDAGSAALLKWWHSRLTEDGRKRVAYPIEVVLRGGPSALLDTPKVVVGTIHSVKGGQADVVYLFPDLSQAGDAQYTRGGASRDAVVRQFYVGATRARERLYICSQASSMAISL